MLKYLLLSSLLALCVSCEKRTTDDFVSEFKSDTISVIKAPSEAFGGFVTADSIPKSDSTSLDSLEVKKDSVTLPPPPKTKESLQKPRQKQKLLKSSKPKPVTELAQSVDYFSVPKTLAEAEALSHLNFERAKSLVNTNLDSAFFHTRFALKIYENGSLYSLASVIQLQKKNFAAAVTSSERSISLGDHWDASDLKTAYRVRAMALKELNQKYPSQESFQKWAIAKNQYESIK